MNQTPTANQPHIAIFGNRNAGKSSLLNALLGQDFALVSPVKGTTTDPVQKTMELIPFGPVVFIDTAGLDDEGELGELRVERSLKVLQKADLAIYVSDINAMDEASFEAAKANFIKTNTPYLRVINKVDCVFPERVKEIKGDAVYVSSLKGAGIPELREQLIKILQDSAQDPAIVGDLLPYNSTVVLVVPIDSEAPKGRLILPQVQVIRDCLDHGLQCHVVRDTELESALQQLPKVDLVITDSQAFKQVNGLVPSTIKLTSFSILFARLKGDLNELIRGASRLSGLQEGAKILMMESCSHNHSHEDIGRIKIPNLLMKRLGKTFNFDYKMGQDFPENLEEYDLVIHCGSCMLNKKTMDSRIQQCQAKGIPITNYGIVIAYLNGILERATEILV
ncbi:MAG: [FeFe] hydrogenase H-cluster maturation GTPase HydF [Desulfitobacterium sp.]